MNAPMKRLALALPLLAAAAGCGDDPVGPGITPTKGIVVLDAVGSLRGIDVADTAAAGTRLAFEPEFDAGGMRLEADTVLTTSSSWGTNKLYVAALGAGTVSTIEMPAGANAAGAVLAHGFQGARVAVALRSTQRVALVSFSGPTPTTVELADVGRCPHGVDMHGADLWVVDYNAECENLYANVGDSRLIRVTAGSTKRDTVTLTGIKNATGIRIVGDVAYVTSIGVTTYAPVTYAPTFVTPGSITAVNLRTRTVERTFSLPAGTSGAGLSIGRDGKLYVTAYLSTAYDIGTFAVDPATWGYAGVRETGRSTLKLTTAAGAQAQCNASTADAGGRLYCAMGQGSSRLTAVYVFDLATGTELRHFNTGGTGPVAIALR